MLRLPCPTQVEAEWRLERKQRPQGSLVLEMGALILLAWQVVDVLMSLTAMAEVWRSGSPASGAVNGSTAMHPEL